VRWVWQESEEAIRADLMAPKEAISGQWLPQHVRYARPETLAAVQEAEGTPRSPTTRQVR